jgi:hypothetical protein
MDNVYTWRKDKHIHTRKTTFWSERTLHKDYDRKDSVEKKISGHESQGAWCQDELIGRKLPVIKKLWLRTVVSSQVQHAETWNT